jgi:hypothetical protein
MMPFRSTSAPTVTFSRPVAATKKCVPVHTAEGSSLVRSSTTCAVCGTDPCTRVIRTVLRVASKRNASIPSVTITPSFTSAGTYRVLVRGTDGPKSSAAARTASKNSTGNHLSISATYAVIA